MNNDIKKIEKEDSDWLLDKKKARAIHQEIMRFGVSQAQLQDIINLLALELEDRDMMLAINRATEQEEEEERPKILHPGGSNNE